MKKIIYVSLIMMMVFVYTMPFVMAADTSPFPSGANTVDSWNSESGGTLIFSNIFRVNEITTYVRWDSYVPYESATVLYACADNGSYLGSGYDISLALHSQGFANPYRREMQVVSYMGTSLGASNYTGEIVENRNNDSSWAYNERFYPLDITITDNNISFTGDGKLTNSISFSSLTLPENFGFYTLGKQVHSLGTSGGVNAVYNTTSPSPTPSSNPTQSSIKVITPVSNPFKQQGVNWFQMRIYFDHVNGGDIPPNVNGLQWQITGYTNQRPKEISYSDVVVNSDGTLSGLLSVGGSTEWNKEVPHEITLTDLAGNVYTASHTSLSYQEFVDEDGDGKDDRTNQDEFHSLNPNGDLPSDLAGANTGLENIGNVFNGLGNFVGQFVAFVGSVFTFLPPQFTVLIMTGLSLVIVMRIFSR